MFKKFSLSNKEQRIWLFGLGAISLIVSHVPYVWMMLTATIGDIFLGAKLLLWAMLLVIDLLVISLGVAILLKRSQSLLISILIIILLVLVLLELPTNWAFFYDGVGDLWAHYFGR